MKTIVKIVKRIFLGIGLLIGIFFLYLFILAIIPNISVPQQPLDRVTPPSSDTAPVARKKEVSFDVKGTPVSAWLYLPEDLSNPVPAVVMGAGMAGTKEMSMEPYALRYQEAGFAVLSFDYRYWGKSGGEPRQLIQIPDQLEDYAAAVAYIRTIKEVDPARICLWGTSLSSGHVLSIAAKDNQIACVIAQIPFLDGMTNAENSDEGDASGLLLLMHAQRDLIRSWLGLSPHTIPIVGKTGSIALMPDTRIYDLFSKHAPQGYINEVPARVVLEIVSYRPILSVQDVRSPVLFQIADHDALVSTSTVDDAARILGDDAHVIHYPAGHFDYYTGDVFEKSVQDQLDFLKTWVGSANGEKEERVGFPNE